MPTGPGFFSSLYVTKQKADICSSFQVIPCGQTYTQTHPHTYTYTHLCQLNDNLSDSVHLQTKFEVTIIIFQEIRGGADAAEFKKWVPDHDHVPQTDCELIFRWLGLLATIKLRTTFEMSVFTSSPVTDIGRGS